MTLIASSVGQGSSKSSTTLRLVVLRRATSTLAIARSATSRRGRASLSAPRFHVWLWNTLSWNHRSLQLSLLSSNPLPRYRPMTVNLIVNADHLVVTIKLDGAWVRLPLEARLRLHEAIETARQWLQAFVTEETR